MNDNVGLILEGGGMRGAFTAGVLDCWMERGLWLKNVYGVSAGACQACSYLCRQPGRGLRVWVDYIHDPRFCSRRSLILTGDMFGAKLNYDLVPRLYDPLDNATFVNSGARFTVVVTDTRTGQPVYMPIRDMLKDMLPIRASASLPLISRMVKIGNRRYLDGGLADSIPLRRAIQDGFTRNVLVLTQAADYRKTPNRTLGVMRLRYPLHPRLIEAIAHRHENYNGTLAFIEAERAAGRAFVLRPDAAPEVGRIEKDPEKLRCLHDQGYATAAREFDALTAFLQG